ncbi:pyocin knob domain-containing protein [Lactobacillus crispatus]|uniref:pyocin knob domain-containing protein n=1 Tax=Lactobacillus crispatus TaxID=47770 RepID=UPI0030FB3461
MDKFKDTIITDAGRKLLINVGAGNGEIAYTRAVLAGQDVSSMADEDIRKLATLENQKMEVNVIVTPPQDNTITVSASFGNKDLTDDLTFSSVGWYAKNNNDNKEILLGVSPSNGEQTLAAGSPDHRSTASIDIDLAMAISNAAKVDLTVNEIGVAHMSDVNAAILKLKAEYDPKIEQAGKVKGAKINDGAVVEPDDDGILDLIVDSDRIKDIPAGVTDLNNLTESGLYRMPKNANTFANRPQLASLFLQNSFLKVINDVGKTNTIIQILVSAMSGVIFARGMRGDTKAWFPWTRITPSNTLSNDDITNMIKSKVDGLNVGQFVKKVNGLTPDGSGNVNVTSTVARGFDANANATTKMTEENLHGGNQILMDQNAGQDIVNWTKGQLNGKLSNSGGDMAEHSTINWNGAGAVESHDGNIGGLTWSGATDNVRLFADNDANDNLDLVIQLGDDNSNAVVIRNSTGAQAARVDASGNISSPTINDLQRQINDLKEDNVNKQKQINDLINNVTYIKDNYVEGRRFPASQEAQAQAWENEKPTRLAMIEK